MIELKARLASRPLAGGHAGKATGKLLTGIGGVGSKEGDVGIMSKFGLKGPKLGRAISCPALVCSTGAILLLGLLSRSSKMGKYGVA